MSRLTSRLASATRNRAVMVAVVATLLLLVATQFVFPGGRGPSRGTPIAVIAVGLITGFAIAVFAVSVVLVYRTMRFVNFALGPIGLVGIVLIAHFLVFTSAPFPLVVIAGLAVCVFAGVIIGTFLLRFFKGSRLFLTVASVIAAQGLFFLTAFVTRLPFFPPLSARTTEQNVRLTRFGDELPFRGWKFHIGAFPLNFGFRHVFGVEIAIMALLAVAIFLRWTKAGVAVRAMAQNPERASLLGIGVGGLSVIVWGIVGLLDGAGALSAGATGANLGFGSTALLAPLAAAAIGRFRDIGTAVWAALMIGVLREAYIYSFPRSIGLLDVILFVIIAGALLAQGRAMARTEVGAQVAWSATDEPRPIPKELSGIPALRLARVGFVTVALVLLVVFPFLVPGRRLLAGVIFIHAIAVLSLVVLTGWAGQVSLGQFGIVAVGSVVGGALTSTVGIPFWFAVPLTAALCAGVAVIVGLPALRIRGLFLLVITFGFAVAVQSVLFDKRYFGWLLPESVERPRLFFFDFNDETSMYFLALASLMVAIVVVRNLRRTRVGRVLIALRESEANVQSFGVSPLQAKLLAFAIAGALAGFAGAMFAHQQHGISAASFTADQSVQVFVEAVIGGVSSPGGALLGTAYLRIVTDLLRNNIIVLALFQGFGPIAILFLAPGGFISLVNAVRDSVLRVVAQRRQIIVPSLFADYDPDVLARQLIPLGEPQAGAGLAALPHGQRFTQSSVLYKGKGVRIADRLQGGGANAESVLFGAAARSALDAEYEEAIVAMAIDADEVRD